MKYINKNKEIHISFFKRGFLLGLLKYKNKSFIQEFTHLEIFIIFIQIDIYLYD